MVFGCELFVQLTVVMQQKGIEGYLLPNYHKKIPSTSVLYWTKISSSVHLKVFKTVKVVIRQVFTKGIAILSIIRASSLLPLPLPPPIFKVGDSTLLFHVSQSNKNSARRRTQRHWRSVLPLIHLMTSQHTNWR